MRNGALAEGREAFARHAWGEAYEGLRVADGREPLAEADLELLAVAGYLIGREPEAVAAWTRAHRGWIARGEVEHAARCGFWISFTLLLGGEPARSVGWLSRTRRLLEDAGSVCVEQGYVLTLAGLLSMGKGDGDEATAALVPALDIAERYGDRQLLALNLLTQGQTLIQMGRPVEGVPLLDEAMVSVTAGEVPPIMAGILYCAVILTCQQIFDWHRSQQWTTALAQWCASQPELVAFRGQCLVHRSEILQLRGDWPEALAEAERASEHLARRSQSSGGRAFYQRGEMHRLRGELEHAERMYDEAARRGAEPQPGMALLRLAQGDLEAASAAIRRVVGEAEDRHGPGSGTPRAHVLGPYVEIMLAAGDLQAARVGVDELARIASASASLYLRATSAQAAAALQLASGDPAAALAAGREAWAAWQRLEAPYEAARVRLLLARACADLDDADTAQTHLGAAASVFDRLGAAPEVARLAGDAGTSEDAIPEPARSLTRREREVLALVAQGLTNRRIAAELHISQHTVARHLSNIFGKIDVTSRTAAGAFALRHGLA